MSSCFFVIRVIEQYFIGCHVEEGSILSLTQGRHVAMPPALKKEEKEKTIKGKEGTLLRRVVVRCRTTLKYACG